MLLRHDPHLRGPRSTDPAPRLAPILVLLLSLLPMPALAMPQGDDGGWSQVSPSGPGARGAHAAAYDPVTESMIVFGGTEALGDTWRYTQTPSPAWNQIVTGAFPTGRKGASMVYDGARRRMLLFGGYDATLNYKNDVWALSLDGTPNWSLVSTTGTPPPARLDQVIALDTKRDRLIVMGGVGYSILNDVWELTLSGTPTWIQLSPASGSPPEPRYGHTGIYDAVGDRLLVWGGSTLDTRTWAFDLTSQTWSALATTGTPPSHPVYVESVYDPARLRMLVFGGWNGASEVTSDTYELSLAGDAWRQLSPVGAPPTGRALSTAVFQPSAGRMLVYGGVSAGGVNVGPEVASLTFGVTDSTPVITSFSPSGGDVGTVVHLYGLHFSVADLAVDFNGVPAIPTLVSDGEVTAPVPEGATSGYIHLATSAGASQSPNPFIVAPAPVLISVAPDSGHTGDPILIHGRHLTGASQLTVGGASVHAYAVVSDTLIQTAVETGWVTGVITVTTPVTTVSSSFTFQMLSPEPRPRLAGVKDVANDQGGKIMVRWYRSERDGVIGTDVVKYRVWRRAPLSLTARVARPVRTDLPALPAALAIDFWEPMGEVPAVQLAGYALTVPTLQDSLPGSNPYTAVFVQAVTTNPNEFVASGVDSSYSVDNLAPAQPGPFVAVYSPGQAALHWLPNQEGDFAVYRLYRSSSSSFVPDAGSLIATLSDTGYVDVSGAPTAASYKLAAVDIHGNVSSYATVTPVGPTAVPIRPTALALAIEELRPNPTRGGAVTLAYSTATAGSVHLDLLDVAGRRVLARDLVAPSAGRWTLALDPSARWPAGVYAVRLRQGAETATARLVISR